MAAAKSTRTQRAARFSRRKPRRRSAPGTVPDLAPIFDALYGARAFVTAAYLVMQQRDNYGPEKHVLAQGVAGLDRVYNDLDHATGRLRRLRRAGMR